MDAEIRIDPDQVGIECRVVELRQRQAAGTMPPAGDHTAAYASNVHLAHGEHSDLTPRDRRVTLPDLLRVENVNSESLKNEHRESRTLRYIMAGAWRGKCFETHYEPLGREMNSGILDDYDPQGFYCEMLRSDASAPVRHVSPGCRSRH